MRWVNYSVSGESATKESLCEFQYQLEYKGVPDILTFWTKQPAIFAELYNKEVEKLKKKGCLVLGHVTLNYCDELEIGTKSENRDMMNFVKLIGNENTRLGFKPIIPNYTTMKHFYKVLDIAVKYRIKEIITGIIRFDTLEMIKKIETIVPNVMDYKLIDIANFIEKINKLAISNCIKLTLCSHENLKKLTPNVPIAYCEDVNFALNRKPDLELDFNLLKNINKLSCCGHCYPPEDWKTNIDCPYNCLYCCP